MQVKFQNVSYIYSLKTPYEHLALKGVSFEIIDQEFVAIIGHTGSGKSTLLQHINGLLLPSEGEITVGEYTITPSSKPKHIKDLRRTAGLVFQFPEYQLFEETVYADIAFGPKNFGVAPSEIKTRISNLMNLVGLSEDFLKRSPFELSGGQKRRVALCGILAMKPDVLILDEPTAGLDPIGASKTLTLYKTLNEQGKTIILVTHEMDVVLQYCSKAILLVEGQVVAIDKPINIFMNDRLLEKGRIEAPMVVQVAKKLIKQGLKLDYNDIKNVNDLAQAIVKAKGGVSK